MAILNPKRIAMISVKTAVSGAKFVVNAPKEFQRKVSFPTKVKSLEKIISRINPRLGIQMENMRVKIDINRDRIRYLGEQSIA